MPSVSVEISFDLPDPDNQFIVSGELWDNRNTQLSIRVHTQYRLGAVNPEQTTNITDEVIRELRENLDLGDNYYTMSVLGTAYNVEHETSATTGAEILINIHEVESYEQ